MSAYETDAYKALYDQLQKSQELVDEAEEKVEELEVRVANAQSNLSSWQGAGNSDMANKIAKINYWQGFVDQYTDELEDWQEKLADRQKRVERDEDALDTFVENYTSSVSQGVPPKEAETLAKKEADEITADYTWLYIAGGVVVVGLIVFFVVRALRKK